MTDSAASKRLGAAAAQTTLMLVEFHRWYREQVEGFDVPRVCALHCDWSALMFAPPYLIAGWHKRSNCDRISSGDAVRSTVANRMPCPCMTTVSSTVSPTEG